MVTESPQQQTAANGGAQKYSVTEDSLKELGIDLSEKDEAVEFEELIAKELGQTEETSEPSEFSFEPQEKAHDEPEVPVKEAAKDRHSATDEELKTYELVYKGEKKYVPFDRYKDLAQQGLDYSVKMMKINQERESFEQEKAQFLSQHEPELTLKRQFDAFVDHLAQIDPEYHQSLGAKMRQFQGQFNNPFVERQLNEIKGMFTNHQKQQEQAQLKSLKGDYQQKLASAKEIFKKYEKIGAKFNEKAFQDKWEKDINTQGEPLDSSAEDLLLDAHGRDIARLMESKKVLHKVQNASKPKAPTLGSIGVRAEPSTKTQTKYRGTDAYRKIANDIVRLGIK